MNSGLLAPVGLSAKNYKGDIILSWTRCSRIPGIEHDSWLPEYFSAPLDSVDERYEIDVLDYNSGNIVNTLYAFSTTTTTYSLSQQVVDFGAQPSGYTFEIFQVDINQGRGFSRKSTFSLDSIPIVYDTYYTSLALIAQSGFNVSIRRLLNISPNFSAVAALSAGIDLSSHIVSCTFSSSGTFSSGAKADLVLGMLDYAVDESGNYWVDENGNMMVSQSAMFVSTGTINAELSGNIVSWTMSPSLSASGGFATFPTASLGTGAISASAIGALTVSGMTHSISVALSLSAVGSLSSTTIAQWLTGAASMSAAGSLDAALANPGNISASFDTPGVFSVTLTQTRVTDYTTGGTYAVAATATAMAVECIGGGGGGTTGTTGGGGAAYAKTNSITLTGGQNIYLSVGTGGSPGNNGTATWVNASANSAPASTSVGCLADYGKANGGAGASFSSVGNVKNNGGLGNSATGSHGGGGGGGAGGPNGAGQNGGGATNLGGGGGGGANNGSAGSISSSSTGGNGGNGNGGSGGGAGGSANSAGTAGTSGTGGGGGGGGGAPTGSPGNGGNGASETGTFVSGGGGGGGGAGSAAAGATGGNGGSYGGGGGAGGNATSAGTAGSGAPGVIRITYTL